MAKTLIEELRWRGLLFDQTEGAEAHLAQGNTSAYIGFDPTSNSLHVGSLLPIMALVHLQRYGHSPIGLVGGATGMIGDPSGKSKERNLLDEDTLQKNVAGIRSLLAKFLQFEGVNNPAKIVNNYDWFGSLSFIQVLRDIGKHFPMSTMLNKESVKRRVSGGGISYTEFSYMILQAYDFLHLFKTEGCTLQMGGSDQWGNITAGSELVRRAADGKVHGVVMPLVTNASGEKFGKTVDGAVWLSADKTSPYKFYQFWLNQSDENALQFIKYFTLCTEEAYAEIHAQHLQEPHLREAQKYLARDVTTRVHGAETLTRVERSTAALFGGDVTALSAAEIEDVFQEAPAGELSVEEGKTAGLLDAMIAVGMTKSKGEARRLIQGGGVSVNSQKVNNPQLRLAELNPIEDRLFVLRKGSKKYFLLRLV
jgi:tyrosyl-tRNA synthetase